MAHQKPIDLLTSKHGWLGRYPWWVRTPWWAKLLAGFVVAMVLSVMMPAVARASQPSLYQCDPNDDPCYTSAQIVHRNHVGMAPFKPISLTTRPLSAPVIRRFVAAHKRYVHNHPAARFHPRQHGLVPGDCGLFGCWWQSFASTVRCAEGTLTEWSCSIETALWNETRAFLNNTWVKTVILCGGGALLATVPGLEMTGGVVFSEARGCATAWFLNHLWWHVGGQSVKEAG